MRIFKFLEKKCIL